MRPAIQKLLQLGPMPSEDEASDEYLRNFEACVSSITRPVTDDEAIALVSLFGPPDSLYGLAWTVLHLVESAPGWPIKACLVRGANEWVDELRERSVRADLL